MNNNLVERLEQAAKYSHTDYGRKDLTDAIAYIRQLESRLALQGNAGDQRPSNGCECGQTREWCRANECPELPLPTTRAADPSALTASELPPLFEPDLESWPDFKPAYSSARMREYARAALQGAQLSPAPVATICWPLWGEPIVQWHGPTCERPSDVDVYAASQPSAHNSEPVAWLARRKTDGKLELAEPNEKATNHEFWTDAFPVYASQPSAEE